jgi:2-C-methyl-D-erythritol 4-phosphate cytidylyltransferase / 2-C-methyl-D-erythritol 2,4-cyclodiphosphate synthase
LYDFSLVLLAAGSGARFEMGPKKQWLYSGEKPLWLHVAEAFESICYKDQIILVSSAEEIRMMRLFASYHYVEGGNSRQASLQNALSQVDTPYVLVSDVARCCLDHAMIRRVLAQRGQADVIVPALDVIDTLYLDGKPIDRTRAARIQTPQLSKTDLLGKALAQGHEYTDESSAIAAQGGTVHFVPGSETAHKLTTIDDLSKLSCIQAPSPETTTGFGIDIHAFEEGKPMVLCGVMLESSYGFKAHSDGDVAIHAVIDALLGAAGMGDIGELFPDTDAQYAGADSTQLLTHVIQKITAYGWAIRHVDLTILAQAPRLQPYKMKMRHCMAGLLGVAPHHVNIKATTGEGLGFVGRKEGVQVQAVATLGYFDWPRAYQQQRQQQEDASL